VDELQSGGYAALSADYPPLFPHWLWFCDQADWLEPRFRVGK